MHHLAIMNKSWKMIPKILSGQKQIESRWYQTKRAPWDKIKAGDTVYFKNSGEKVTAQVQVSEVMQFQIESMADVKDIVAKYGKAIGLVNKHPETWGSLPKYCVLTRLKDPREIKIPFNIDKTGFGTGAAWLTVENIDKIKI